MQPVLPEKKISASIRIWNHQHGANMVNYGLYMPNFGAFGDARTVAKIAADAENSGWDGLFLWDHVARPMQTPVVDPWVALAAAAMITERINLGTMITPLPRRRPWKLARETTSLDRLSNGRVILGAGIGSGRPSEWENLGEETDPRVRGAMLDEGLDVLTKLWTGELVSHDGAYYTVTDAYFLPAPVQSPRIPVWIGGNYPNKAPLRRAARWDGVFPILNAENDDIPTLAAQLKEVVTLVQDYRVDNTPFEVATVGVPTPGDDRDAAAEMVAPFIDAGATWWLENIAPWRFGMEWDSIWDLDVMRERVLQGPPRL
jgi:probable F420-dependent oxidoreductase